MIEDQVVCKFIQVFIMDPQRVYDHFIFPEKFHKIDTAESCCILILLPSCHIEVHPFDLKGEVRKVVFTQRKAGPFGKGTEYCHNQCGRSTKARTRGSIDICGQLE